MRIPGVRCLSLAQQYNALRGNPICPGAGEMRGGRLTWNYETEPTPLSRTYIVRIGYQLGRQPEIWLRRPHLPELAGERRLPHVYQQDPPRLCLYRPGRGEWTPLMRLDETIVPWTSLWLYYFEDWLGSNVWKGGGEHPTSTDKPLPRECARQPLAKP